MGLKLITAPAVEPLTRTDAYVQCQIDTTTTGSPPVTTSDHDAWIDSIIPVLRNEAEAQSNRALVTQTWELWLDDFVNESAHWTGGYIGGADSFPGVSWGYGRWNRAIYLPLPPLQSVTSIIYVDENGDTQTLDPTTYVVDNSVEPARIVPKVSACWPRVQCGPGAVKIRFVAGYAPIATGSPPTYDYIGNIPKDIMHWMRLHMSHWFRNRESSWQVTSTSTVAEMPYVADLINRYRVFGYGRQT
jgi:uncharacterized phiE125 gp8 family phage protein